jgi:hypothetical protein
MRDGYRVVDAVAHVIEPDDLWARYFDQSLAIAAAPEPSVRIGSTACHQHTDGRETDPRPSRRPARRAHLGPSWCSHAYGFVAVPTADMDVEGVSRSSIRRTALRPQQQSTRIGGTCRVQQLAGRLLRRRPRAPRGVGMIAQIRTPRRQVPRRRPRVPSRVRGRTRSAAATSTAMSRCGSASERLMTIGLQEADAPPKPGRPATSAEQKHICSHPMEQMVRP